MHTVFTKIRNGQIPANFVWQDEYCFAITDINPYTKGHILLIPNEEVDGFWEADKELMNHLQKVAKILTKAQLRTFRTERVCQLMIGFDIPHLHLHLVPSEQASDLDKPADISAEEIAEGAEMLRKTLREMGYNNC